MDTNIPVQNTEDYRQLINHMTEGFAIAQMIFNEQGQPVDYVILEVNPAYEQQSGLKRERVLGKRAGELLPAVEHECLIRFGGVVLTGTPAGFELFSAPLGRWFDVRAFSLQKDNKFGILFTDCTDRKNLEEAKRRQEAEEALRCSEQQLRLATQAAGMYTWELDVLSGKITFSGSVKEIVGFSYTEHDDVFSHIGRYAVPEDGARHQEALERTMRGEGDLHSVTRVINPETGKIVWMETYATLMQDGNGKPSRVVGIARNITEFKRAEEVLRESEERFRAVQENSLDRFTILKPFYDDHGEIIDFTYVYQNAHAAKTAGRRPEELIGVRMTEFWPNFTETRFFETYKLAVKTGQGTEFEDSYTTDGLADWFRAVVTPIPDGIAVATQIITERKRMENELRRSEEKYHALFNNAEYGFALIEPLLDENGRVKDLYYMEINPAFERETGLKIADFLGRRLKEILPDIEPRFLKAFDKAFRMGKTMRFEGFNKDTGHWYEQVVFPYANGLLGEQFINITERKCVEEMLRLSEKRALTLVAELEEADRNKNEFISVLSHELRNPLAAIVAGLTVLGLPQGSEKNEEVKQIIKRQSGQLCKLVDDLLDLTRITHNKIKLKREAVLLNELVMNAAEDVKPQYENKGVLLDKSIPEQPVTLYADPVRIMQSIGNLLHNALKFTPAGGCVWVSLEQEGNDAVIRVRDNGAGIEQEILEELFTPFVQADHFMHRESSSGLGLGLAIVKNIAELHGGSVEAQSKGPGQGALFTVRLPVAAGAEQPAAPNEARTEKTKHRRVLMIEDNRDLADVLCEMMEVLGHEAHAAYHGIDGLKMAEELRPDVIFCDIGLPGMDGYEVARILKQSVELKSIFLVALTGFAGENHMEQARQSGFDAHMAKPVTLAALDRMLAMAE